MEMLFGIIGIIVVVVLLYGIGTYNQFIRVKNKVDEALSGIDVALAKRYAILTNLVEVVKRYVQHEHEVLVSLVKLRNGNMLNRVEVDQNQLLAKEQLFALQEAYPELKANEQFLSLQAAIQDVEEHLAASRRMYNSNVSIYNDLVLSFPSNLIGNMINAGKMEYFIAKEEERENINITL